MAKWRPIDTRLWNDRKFLALSDGARLLWIYLLTSSSTISIPGVIVAGDEAMAEQLGWTSERLRERFHEIQKVGLSVEREGRLTWLPNALRYQPPSNPNAVKSWAKTWDDVPEGALKIALWQALKTACKSWSVLFAKGFREPLHDGSANGSVNGCTNGSTQDQEQDQEQKQDQEQDLVTRFAPPKAKRSRKCSLPADWQPNETAILKARELGVDVKHEADTFRDHHTAKGSTFVDWQAAFRTWLGNAQRFARGSYAPTKRNNPTETSLAGLREAEERERRGVQAADPFGDVPHAAEVGR